MTVVIWLTAAYLSIGFILLIFGPFWSSIARAVKGASSALPDRSAVEISSPPRWKLAVYWMLLAMGVLVVWPILLPGAIKESGRHTEIRAESALDIVQKLGGKVLVTGYRRVAHETGIAPTSRTSDDEIVSIHVLVASAFRQAAHERGEYLSAPVLNFIVLKFFQVAEQLGTAALDAHLSYEVEMYRANGLRPDYARELYLF